MGIKDVFILLLVIVLVGSVLFGSVGNFFGLLSGISSDMSNVANNAEGYVYSGGNVSELINSPSNPNSRLASQSNGDNSYKYSDSNKDSSSSGDSSGLSQTVSSLIDGDSSSGQSSSSGSGQGSSVVDSSGQGSSSSYNSGSSSGSGQGSSVVDSSGQGSYNSGSSSGSGQGSSSNSSQSNSSGSKSQINYTDWQENYETGMVDLDGNPIILSVVSSSGGQMEPGIYEVYWSANGPINQTKIG